jgi:hypothetical protein
MYASIVLLQFTMRFVGKKKMLDIIFKEHKEWISLQNQLTIMSSIINDKTLCIDIKSDSPCVTTKHIHLEKLIESNQFELISLTHRE